MKENMIEGPRVFNKSLTPTIKGFAIILMFFLHILSPGVLSKAEKIIDFSINGQYISSYLALSGNICIGIFAFITGYGWSVNFEEKTYAERIWKPWGGIYYLFYVAMFLFCFPMREVCYYLETGGLLHITWIEALSGLTAYHSESVYYGWYVYFFALAVLTYKFFRTLFHRIHFRYDILNIGFILIVFMFARIVCRILFRNIFHIDVAMSVTSHYCQWMPVVMLGTYTRQSRYLEKIDGFVFRKISGGQDRKIYKYRRTIYGILIFIVIFGGKTLVQGVTGNYSNFDSFIIIPFMYALILIAEGIHNSIIGSCIAFVGTISTMMWFTHCVFRYEPFSGWLCLFRFPIAILLVGIMFMIPVSYILTRISSLLALKLNSLRW